MQELIEQKHEEVIAAMAGVDALIMDSSYTDTEYANRHGWGHGTYGSAMNFAAQAGAKQLFLTHHEPTRSDADLEAVFASLLQGGESEVSVCLAREGEGFDLLDSGVSK
jgi:ribonuclease BN (tRNA processing enzyme)